MSDITDGTYTEIPKDGLQPIHGGVTKLIAVQIVDLPKVWPSLRGWIAEMDNPEQIIPEEIYAALYCNQATLFLLQVQSEDIGFMVVRAIKPSDLHIWLLHAKNGYECLNIFRNDLMGIAKIAGASKLTFGSRRKAWQKVAVEHGFNVRMITYECPVQ